METWMNTDDGKQFKEDLKEVGDLAKIFIEENKLRFIKVLIIDY